MKKLLTLLAVAPILSVASPLYAQTETAPMPTAPTENAPVMSADESAALELMDKSAAAYAALDGLAMKVVTYDTQNGVTTRKAAQIELEKSGASRLRIGDKVESLVTGAAKNSAEAKVALSRAMFALQSASSIPLAVLVGGQNPLSIPTIGGQVTRWQKIRLLPDNGVGASLSSSSRLDPDGYEIPFSFYFDPTDHLLRRVEAKAQIKGQSFSDVTTFSDVQINPQFPAGTFDVPKMPEPTAPQPTAAQPIAAKPAEVRYWSPKLVVGAAPFALTGADLGKYRGKVVLLDFWATWCGPCVAELPSVLSNYRKYRAKGFDIIGISLDDDKKALDGFIKARKMPWPQLFDGKGWKNVNAVKYGVQAIPFTLLVGKDGKIAAVNPRGEELEPAIKAALAK